MAKKILFESFKYRFLITARDNQFFHVDSNFNWEDFLRGLEFINLGKQIKIEWKSPNVGSKEFNLTEATFYKRGDTEKAKLVQVEENLMNEEDKIKKKNEEFFKSSVKELAQAAGFANKEKSEHQKRIDNEREFHDDWAKNEDLSSIDVKASNEVCTAPEMRYIVGELGDIKGKKLLDVGCGLGEASVYFALLGADVTSSDLSQGMLDATSELAKRNGVEIKKHLASAEDMQLDEDEKFDIIYSGNLLHHVDVEPTLERIKPHLASNGVLATWDPIHYNPIINIYRSIATEVRTPDEHPLKIKDIKTFKKIFPKVKTKHFWLTTLIIFAIMAIGQRRNPNNERYWKVVIEESEKWAWLYRPLEFIDKIILKIFPPLKWLCWNIVVISRLK